MITKENIEINANGEVVIPSNHYEIIPKPQHPTLYRDIKVKEEKEDKSGEAIRKKIDRELTEGRDKLKIEKVEWDKKEISLSALQDILLSMDTKDFYEGKKGSPTRGLYEKQRLSDIRSQRKFENGNWGRRFLREKASREERLTTALFDARETEKERKLIYNISKKLRHLRDKKIITNNYYKNMLVYLLEIKDQVKIDILKEILRDIHIHEIDTKVMQKNLDIRHENEIEIKEEEEERKKKIELYIKNWERLDKERGWKT